jgi:hypothetical protein
LPVAAIVPPEVQSMAAPAEPITVKPAERVASPEPPISADAGLGSNPIAVDASPSQWAVVITIDPAQRHPDSPEPPADQAPITRSLDPANTLVGRNSQMRAIYPDIALDWDDAVSHRHALINRLPDGKLTVRDIGSANGTSVNGIEIAPMVDITINNGDEITLGHWTKLKIMETR